VAALAVVASLAAAAAGASASSRPGQATSHLCPSSSATRFELAPADKVAPAGPVALVGNPAQVLQVGQPLQVRLRAGAPRAAVKVVTADEAATVAVAAVAVAERATGSSSGRRGLGTALTLRPTIPSSTEVKGAPADRVAHLSASAEATEAQEPKAPRTSKRRAGPERAEGQLTLVTDIQATTYAGSRCASRHPGRAAGHLGRRL